MIFELQKTDIDAQHIFQVIVAIFKNSVINYFDVQSKAWKELSSMQPLTGVQECYCAELIGNYLYVAAQSNCRFVICRYDIVCDTWSTLRPIPGSSDVQIGCLCNIKEHLYVIYRSNAPYRYNIATNQWQSMASSNAVSNVGLVSFCNKAAAVYKSCLYVLYPQGIQQTENGRYVSRAYNSLLYRFDPEKNAWEQKASTKTPHFGSSLVVVNHNLYVVGGNCSFNAQSFQLSGNRAAVEVYNDQENVWSVVEQTHIPPNNLRAVEIDGRVYFVINSFVIDSGITIPPGEVFPAVLDGWENLGRVAGNAVLCYLPVKTENHTTENE